MVGLLVLLFLCRMQILSVMLLLDFLVLTHNSSAFNKMWDKWKFQHRKVYDNQVNCEDVSPGCHAWSVFMCVHCVCIHTIRSLSQCLCFSLRLFSGEQFGRRTCSWWSDTTRRPQQENTASQWDSIIWLTWWETNWLFSVSRRGSHSSTWSHEQLNGFTGTRNAQDCIKYLLAYIMLQMISKPEFF